MRQRKAVYPFCTVVVPGSGVGVWAPLDHAERERGAGKRVAVSRGSNDRINTVVGRFGSRRSLRAGQRNQAAHQRKDERKAASPRFDRAKLAAMPGLTKRGRTKGQGHDRKNT